MSTQKFRPPVITVLGHVDHGKTSLLDRIRSANVALKEAGGITQAIGAYQIEYQDKKITFIDTPGHAAFAEMRRRGGQVADIAILVVAADDGVMPQTKESIKYIKAAGVPYLVAINKIDAPGADSIRVKTGLAEAGEYVEGFGGTIPVCEVSAKTGDGIDHLLETLLLMAEMEQLVDNSELQPSAVVIESSLHSQKGPLATLIVKTGVFKTNDNLFDGAQSMGKIRSMISHSNEYLTSAGPSTPIQILGFSAVPKVGDLITTKVEIDESSSVSQPSLTSVDIDPDKANILVKADFAGSLEAVCNGIKDKVNILSASIGPVNESDIDFASVNKAIVIGFNSKMASSVARLAEIEKIQFNNFNIIYQLFDYITDLAKSYERPPEPEIQAEAKVLKVFTPNNMVIYGCQVTSGVLKVNDYVGKSQIISLQIGMNQVEEVHINQECGLIIKPKLDFKSGDTIIAYNQPK